ncbi:site-specific integrase [Aliarcobacter cryaerophilus]|uniref:site-specific integrase n=1 Tax=Aliarcobacter cryaerophilus TaxID=28198 RepID=UPI0021B6469F|nr:site-specific integrase [Aliarcobacter cryaerophilus]MCT7530000.1 site-specific integrase [Aliarcobacter cryaerophilus]
MPKLRFTTDTIKRLKPPIDKSKVQYFDSELTGFMLEVKNTGTKTYYYRYRVNTSQKMIRIGTTTELNFQQAKEKYLELKENQTNPQEHSPQKEKSLITFLEFYNSYYLPYIKAYIKSYETNISVFKNHILKDLSNTSMADLKKLDIKRLHNEMITIKNLSRATANKFLIFLSSAYKLANEFELLNSYNPCRGIKEFELNNQRQIFLTQSQTKRLLNEVNKSSNIHLKYIVPMLLLSGARKREVLDAKWCDFDNINNLWTIPLTKNGKKRILPITKPLQTILNQIPKDKTPYLFASPLTLKPYISIYQSWNSARTKANLKEVRMHDLRHTYASALVNAKCSLYEVQVLLGHSTAKMTQRYAHLSNESLMKASSCAGRLLK